MGYNLIEYNNLKEELKLAIRATVQKHGYKSIEQLDPERKLHVQTVLKTMEVLDAIKSDDNEKEVVNNNSEAVSADKNKSVNRDLILNAMALHMRDVTYLTYKVRSAENSGFYGQLGIALGLVDVEKGEIKEAKPTPKQKHELLQALHEFMCLHVYTNSSRYEGYLPLEEQPFSTVKNFDTNNFMRDLLVKVQACELKAHDDCHKNSENKLKETKANYKKAEKQETSGYGLGSLWRTKSSKNETNDECAGMSLK